MYIKAQINIETNNMTAVIGILNKHAVAVAADSAVTVGAATNTKIFNRANKIFRLSKYHPVGLMIWNHGNFMGIPWEVVIKYFRQQLDKKSFSTVEEYKNEFISFLKTIESFKDSSETKTQIRHFIVEFLIDLLRLVGSRVADMNIQEPNNYVSEFNKLFKNVVEDAIKNLQHDKDYYDDFKDFDKKQFDQIGTIGLQQNIQEILSDNGLSLDISEHMSLIRELAIELIKSKKIEKRFSGLVFTGFGEDEIFPSLHSAKVSFLINNKLRWKDDVNHTINHNQKSAIAPFAQTDVIDTILSGIDPAIGELYFRNINKFLEKNYSEIASLIEKKDKALADKLRNIDTQQLLHTLASSIQKQQKKIYIQPMMQALVNLSKEDLAEMAESLVYLTYLKRRFTFAEESVGGPVDVAIITKGDGFVWIKRKHYFDQDLNHHFFKNY